MSHTPGPWVTKGFKIWEERKFVQGRAGIVGEASISWHDSKTTEANARLIAAAPDLLQALEDLEIAEQIYRHNHDLHGAGDMRTGQSWDKMRKAGDRARAAIAKAKPERKR